MQIPLLHGRVNNKLVRDKVIAEKDALIERNAKLNEKNAQLNEKDAKIKALIRTLKDGGMDAKAISTATAIDISEIERLLK